MDAADLLVDDSEDKKKMKKVIQYDDLLYFDEKDRMVKGLHEHFDPFSNPIDMLCLKNVLGEDFENHDIQEMVA